MSFNDFCKETIGWAAGKLIHVLWYKADTARLFHQGYYLGDHRALMVTLDGRRLIVDTEDISLTPTLLAYGIWEPDVTAFLKRLLKPGMTVVEVGSNIGYFSTFAALRVGDTGHVYAFEPNPRTLAFLEDNVDINGYASRITIIPAAASATAGTTTLTQPVRHSASGSIVTIPDSFFERRHDTARSIEVPTTTIDATLAALRVSKVDIVKVDAEGSELLVLEGMKETLSANPSIKIICEFNPEMLAANGMSREEFLTRITSYGFTARAITKKGLVDISQITFRPETVADLYLERAV